MYGAHDQVPTHLLFSGALLQDAFRFLIAFELLSWCSLCYPLMKWSGYPLLQVSCNVDESVPAAAAASGKFEISEVKGYRDIPPPGNYRPMPIGIYFSIPAGGKKNPAEIFRILLYGF
mgnify:CR=1 FL=1